MTGSVPVPKSPDSHHASKKLVLEKDQQGVPAQVYASQKYKLPNPPPAAPPSFSVGDIRRAIPPHCFKRSAVKGFAYLFVDLALIAAIVYGGLYLYEMELPLWASVLVWPLYWYAQGSVMTGVWVIAHECGHQAFSDSRTLNDAVGMVCHSALLVPYHSWRISHSNHHQNTCSMENDEVFVPFTRSEMEGHDMEMDVPLMSLWGIVRMLVFGWPTHLVLDVTGPAKHRNKPNSHFNPHSSLFRPKQAKYVVYSDIGLAIAFSVLGWIVYEFGWAKFATFYLVPYLIVNLHLVLITFLQHTAPYIPHYREGEFSWLRGALSTVDRSFGKVMDHVLHHIVDTHVAHHLFHTMPFYHAQEATEAIKPILGDYYLKDDMPITQALWLSFTTCRFVEDEGQIVHYKTM